MKLYNLVKTDLGKDGKIESQSVSFSSTDEETAMRVFRAIALDGQISNGGKTITRKFYNGTIVYSVIESDLMLGNKNHTEELLSIYKAYFDVLVVRLQQWGEKDISKAGDIIYRLDIEKMDFHISDYNDCKTDLKICEIDLNQNPTDNYIELISENGEKRISLQRCELHNIERLVSFIDELTNLITNK